MSEKFPLRSRQRTEGVILAVFFLLGPILIAWHALHGNAGYPSHDSDYLQHLGFVRQLLAGDVWPPPYFGMIGSHALAALIAWSGSMLPTRAMLFASDLCLTVMFVAVGVSLRRASPRRAVLTLCAVLFVVLPAIMRMQNRGFYGQTCSSGIYAAYLCALGWHIERPSFGRA